MVKLPTVYITHYILSYFSAQYPERYRKCTTSTPVIFICVSLPPPPPPLFPQGMNKVCTTWLRRALTVPNRIHNLLHQLPLLIFVSFKMAFSKASVFRSSERLIKFDVWNHHCSLVIPLTGQIYLRSARQKHDVWIRPNSNRGQIAG